MIPVPSSERDIIDLANLLIEQCRVSVGMRGAYYRLMNAIAETGRYDGTKSLINMLYMHLARTAAHLYSPTELKFALTHTRRWLPNDIERGGVVAEVLSDTWIKNGTDVTFGRGVFESLKYGAAIMKQWPEQISDDDGAHAMLCDKLVMPWQFGVYREDENRLERQEAVCETVSLTLPEVWRRIYHLPDAKKLFEKIKSHAKTGEATSGPDSFFHQVLSTSQLNTGVQGMTRPVPGGIVQLNNDPNYSIMGPVVAAEVVQMHELWVKDDTGDYTTIQLIEPDILVAPRHKKANLLGVPRSLPYRLIQPNEVTNWFWGRSELVDLIEPQALLSTWMDDTKRLFGLQIDKILGFTGENGIDDELYGQFRAAGYVNLGAGADIKDITPKFPPEALPMIKFIIEIVNMLSGFPEIMQGKGEAGVRAGVHANTLLKTGSPHLRDRSLLVERQCAASADLTLSLMEAKDPSRYWTKADTPKAAEETSFLLSDLPDDWRVTVDSHSSSPIFADENAQLIVQAAKMGYVGGDYVIDNLPFPNKATAKHQLKEKEKKQADFMANLLKNNPQVADKLLEKQALGKR